MDKNAHLRFIINADTIAVAENIFKDIVSKISFDKKSLTGIKKFEDDYHFEVSFTVRLIGEDFSELEYKAFKLCTVLADGPWLFLKLPVSSNKFTFEAIFNHEAFIINSNEYSNKLKWAHLEVE